jgi:hypothetical protein
MKSALSTSNQSIDGEGTPVVHWAAISSGVVIGSGLALVAGALWTAAAFSSHNGAFYNHLTWWFGGTVAGASLVGALVASGISRSRGPVAGVVNGLTTWGIIALLAGTLALVAAVTNGTSSSLAVHGSVVKVEFLRPYVAFWSSVFSFGAAGIGGFLGGMIPRRRIATGTPELTLARPNGRQPVATSTDDERATSAAAS